MHVNTHDFLTRLNICVERYSRNNLDVDVQAELRGMRRDVARILLDASPQDLGRLYAGPLGQSHRVLLNCGLRDELLTAEEQVFADDIARRIVLEPDTPEVYSRLFACMLYLKGYEVAFRPGHFRVPQWIVWNLLVFMFLHPWVFRRQEHIERYCSYASDTLHLLHDMLLDTNNSAEENARLVNDVATPLVSLFSCNPLYFDERSLKSECGWRARLMEHVCRFVYLHKGLSLDHVYKPSSGRRKTRIGILCPQFKSTSETFATLPVFEYLDRDRFEIILYTLKVNGSALERYCSSRADRLVDISTRIDQQLRTIRGDDLDILVIGTNVVAFSSPISWLALHRLARVQVTSICSPTTTGMRNMDCYIAGELALPADDPQRDYTERLVTVPGSGICFSYGPARSSDSLTVERRQVGIPDQATVYICGSNFFKLLPRVRELYACIIAGVPGSVLVMYPFNPNWTDAYPPSTAQSLTDEMRGSFANLGVEQERLIILQPRENFAEIQAILRQADIYLDSFPYSGATSIADALQAHLPPVVMDGRYLRFRQAVAILRELDLPELVAADEAEYLNLAISLGRDASLRRQIVERIRVNLVKPGNFLDSRTFSQQMGRVFEEMLSTYRACRSQ
jgi:predicted O-linked N-acetylglucosamine transferase (SPINDLY family)